MTDQINLRNEILALIEPHIGDPTSPEVIRKIIDAAVSCMGAAAFMIGLMPERLRQTMIDSLTDQLPLTVAKRAAEIRRGEHDGRVN